MDRYHYTVLFLVVKALCLPVLLLVLQAETVFAERVFKVNTSIKPPFSTENQEGFIDLVIKEMFSRLDLPVTIVRLPPERAMAQVNSGTSDGELPRVGGLSETYPGIVQVPEKIIDYDFVGFAQPVEIRNLSFKRIRDLRVGIIIGWKIYENNTRDYPSLTKVNFPVQLFQMLAAERLDVALYEKYAGQYLIKSLGITNVRECGPSLASMPMFLYVNQRHAKKVAKMAEVIRQMKADGTWDRFRRKTLEP